MAWDPLRDVNPGWPHRLVRLAEPSAEPWTPAIDVYETADAYIVTAEVPGLRREEIAIELRDTRLAIRGKRSARSTQRGEIVHYHQIERGHGAFARTFEFAESIDSAGVTADLTDGVLSVTLRKLPPAPPRRIDVR